MASVSAGAAQTVRRDNLALLFQEVLTAIVRLRAGRQALSDAESFRHHMREAIKASAQEARNRSAYSTDDVRMSTLAIVGFLDESVLNTRNPIFADWPRKPLQEELFGTHMAGEVFFQNLEQLMSRNDSQDLGDTLEIHYLCLLLGYNGRFSGGRSSELQGIINAVGERIRRIRGNLGDLSPAWAPGPDVAPKRKDPWALPLLIAAVASLVIVIALFVTFYFVLGSGVSDVRAMSVSKG